MKFSSLALSAALFASFGHGASIRGVYAPVPMVGANDPGHRMLHMEDFQPLSCNDGISKKSCQPWTQRFGSDPVHYERIIIECGECVEMDSASDLTLADGIDVRGKLLFKHGYELTMNTTMIAVQGELIMLSRKAVDGTPAVKIVMTGESDQYFQPIEENAMNCGRGGACNAGKKAIVVAGGRIRWKGVPDDTPSWVKLHDVERILDSNIFAGSGINPFIPPPTGNGCAADGVYFSSEFLQGCGSQDEFSTTPGALSECTSNAFKVVERTSTDHGHQLDLKNFRHCLDSTRTYLLTAQVRLSKNGSSGSQTDCSDAGKGCLTIQHEYVDEDSLRRRSILWKESPALGAMYGELLTIAIEIEFSLSELADSNVYQLIELFGPAPGVDVEVEEIHLYLPPEKIYPGPGEQCQSLVPVNGDAEVGSLSPFPFYASHDWLFISVDEDPDVIGNHFFKVRGRTGRLNEKAGLSWDVDPSCLHEGAYLQFRANVRLPRGYQSDLLELKPSLRAKSVVGGTLEESLADCPVIEGSEWVKCIGTMIVPPEFVSSDIAKLTVLFGGTAGVEYDVDDISISIGGSEPNTLIVDKAVEGKWAEGAELLVTSHTTQWNGHQVRKIQKVLPHDNPSFVRLKLDSTISRPTTILDDPTYAVEVALLSRNILFEGGPDFVRNHGGHFWVMHTPNVDQYIEGIEFRNFGQQGTLGKYPIHFHFCSESDGSRVLKNTVRNSNQRAIVVHGTNNLRVEENVVFNTKGHAIILEDGMETGNMFYRNLGCGTGAVDVVIPDNGSNGKESDALPATFWISNPSNSWVDNVAAGSESSGFWFELRLRGTRADMFPDLDPRSAPLGQFSNNVAHSNKDRGLRTYPRGYIPEETANLIGFSSYRNNNKGLFFHQTSNINIISSHFADNGIALDLDRAEIISVINTTIIGQSDLYSELVDFQDAPSVCSNQNELVGIEVHSFTRKAGNNGANITGTSFSGFETGTCGHVAHIKFDDEKRLGTFDWYTSFEQVEIHDRAILFDFCPAAAEGVTDAYMIDIDGSLDGFSDGLSSGGPGSIISNSADMMAFLDPSSCTINNDGCNAYCDACFRSVRFDVEPSQTEGYKLQVCETSGSPCINIHGNLDPDKGVLGADNHRVFNAHLPAGSYKATFKDQTGNKVWPAFVMERYEDKLCPEGFDAGAVQLSVPKLPETACTNLIRNGNISSLDGWLEQNGGLTLARNSGIEGSSALADTRQFSPRDSFIQFLDTRCFDQSAQGRLYEIRAWVKLLNRETRAVQECQLNGKVCPEVRIAAPGLTRTSVATLVPQLSHEGEDFQLLHGLFRLDQEFVASSSLVEFIVQRNRVDLSMQVDNVEMNLMHVVSESWCRNSDSNLVHNGDFASGDAAFWSRSSAEMKMVKQPNGFSLSLTKGGNAQVFLQAGCFVTGQRYEISIRYKILGSNGVLITCDPTASKGSEVCPSAKLLSYSDEGFLGVTPRVVRPIEKVDDGWNVLYGVFTAETEHQQADRIMLQLEDFHGSNEYILDSAQIQFRPEQCSENMLINSDLHMGATSFWTPIGSGSVEWTSDGFSDGGAVLSSGRTLAGHGPKLNTFVLDTRCITPGTTWEVSAQIRLSSNGQPASCDLVSSNPNDACPSVRIEIKDKSGVSIMNVLLRQYVNSSWKANGWNEFRATISLPSLPLWDGSVDFVWVQVRNFSADLDVTIDDFVIRQV